MAAATFYTQFYKNQTLEVFFCIVLKGSLKNVYSLENIDVRTSNANVRTSTNVQTSIHAAVGKSSFQLHTRKSHPQLFVL